MAAARLPGISFETVAPPATGALPRMDIAAFCGFAPSGPVALPFAVEDPERFHEVFGNDLPLAWNRERGEMELAQLPAAVRAFFRNGGRRCWVVRLAGTRARPALTNRFLVPGLLRADANGGLHAGWVRARSEGSWSDGVAVNAALLERLLPAAALTGAPAVDGLKPGELAQAYFPASGSAPGVIAYYAPDGRWFWFEEMTASTIAALGSPVRAFALDAGADRQLSFAGFRVREGNTELVLARDLAVTVAPGAWLRLEFASAVLLMQVEDLDAGASVVSSQPAGDDASLASTLVWRVLDAAAAWTANRPRAVQLSVVTFEMWARPQSGPVLRLSDLGMAEGHPRFFGLLPTDQELYTPPERPGTPPFAALALDIDHPRYPLAAPPRAGLALPLGITAVPRPEFFQTGDLPGATALERDGLATFSTSVFVDPNLAGSESRTLLRDAFYYRYQAEDAGPLSGMHALVGVDEPALLAIPDAAHRGWTAAEVAAGTIAAPDPLVASAVDAGGNYSLTWTAVAGADGYELEESSDSQFGGTVTTYEMGGALSRALVDDLDCPTDRYYRASARGKAGLSPYSETRRVRLGAGPFKPCLEQPLEAPGLSIDEVRDRVILQWTRPAGATGFVLETAGDPRFASAQPLFSGAGTRFEIWRSPGPPTYYRVAALRGTEAGPWSQTVATAEEPPSPFATLPDDPAVFPTVQFEVQRAMLRLAAARADMVAVLNVPYGARTADAAGYLAEFKRRIAPEDDDGRMLSYAAMYHPWLVVRDNSNAPPASLRRIAPDGIICGTIAARTLDKGAWIAPANIPLSSVIALEPLVDFTGSQINVILREAAGFVTLAQQTLSDDPQYAALNVRRLLILLRRLALREGNTYVFQNISATLVRQVTRQFEGWMRDLLNRGAFAGLTAAESYRVSASASVNTPQIADAGRFIVELRVAPSRPLQFLTVRLIQSGSELSLQEA